MFRPHETELTQRKEDKTRVIFATACSLTSDRFLQLQEILFFSFSRWVSPACRPLYFSLYSKFVDMTINLSFENTLDNTDTEKISAFRFHLYWLFSCLFFTRRGWLCDFPPKKTRVAFGLPYCWLSYFTLVCLWCGRTVGRAYGHVITKIDNQIFLPMVLRFARVELHYKCNHCSKTFKSRSSRYTHTRKHQGQGNIFRCEKCSFIASRKSTMDKHNLTAHVLGKLFKCDCCSTAYKQKARLDLHKRTHTGEKPFTREECDKAFIDTYSLKRHKRTHTGEKPNKCSYCDKSFAQGCHRQLHERTHTGERPYGCEQCDKKFSRRQELNKHLNTHEKPKQPTKNKRKWVRKESQWLNNCHGCISIFF